MKLKNMRTKLRGKKFDYQLSHCYWADNLTYSEPCNQKLIVCVLFSNL